MKTTINHCYFSSLLFIVMLFYLSTAIYAQNNNSAQTPSSHSVTFNDDAKKLADKLIDQIGANQDKSSQISQILINYRNDIAQAQNDYLQAHQEQTQNEQKQDVTGGQSKVDMTGILGDNVSKYYESAPPDLMKNYRNADQKADNQIKEALSNPTLQSRYDQIKDQWWKNVKDIVFSSFS